MRAFVLGFLSGVVFLFSQKNLPSFSFFCFLIPLILVIFFLKFQFFNLIFYFLLGVVFGAGYSFNVAQNNLKEQLKKEYSNQDVFISGVVLNKPQKIEKGVRFLIEPNNPNFPKKILVRWYENNKNLKNNPSSNLNAGDEVHLNLRLKKPHGFYNEGGMDYEGRLFAEGIGATAYVRHHSGKNYSVENKNNSSFFVFTERLRLKIENQILKSFPKEQYPWVGILIALSIGEQSAIHPNEWALFNQTAVTHLFSISGLHITFLSVFFAFLCSFLWKQGPFLLKLLPLPLFFAITSASFAFFYALIAGFGVPAQRSLYMLLSGALALVFYRRITPSQAWSFALLVVLLYSPFSVFAIGFWLSFGTVGILLFIGFAYVLAPPQSFIEKIKKQFFIFWRTQWAATLFTFPILLFVFGRFPWMAFFANAVAIPLVSIFITPLVLLGSCLLFLSEECAVLFFTIAHFLLDALMAVLNFLASFPLYQQSIPFSLMLFALLGVVFLLLPKGFKGKNLGVFLILPVLFYATPRPKEREVWVDFLDVGQGLSVLVRTQNHNLLFDTAFPLSTEYAVLPFLRKNNIQNLDVVVLSHEDEDHSAGLELLKKHIPIQEVRASFPPFKLCEVGQSWRWDQVEFSFLSPFSTVDAEFFSKTQKKSRFTVETNARSCVLKIKSGEKSLLLTADIPEQTEKELVEAYEENLKANVLQLAHHGSLFSNSETFLKSVAPDFAVVSAGFENRYHHPSPVVLKRLENADISLWRTDEMGQIHVVLQPQSVKIKALRATELRFWH